MLRHLLILLAFFPFASAAAQRFMSVSGNPLYWLYPSCIVPLSLPIIITNPLS